MFRLVFGFFGSLFSTVVLGIVAAALGIGGLLFLYSHDLPDHETLSNYAPPTISRIYSREGVVVDEFADERRLFVPIEEIPDMVANAFISAEDRNFWEHQGYDPRAIVSAFVEAVVTRGQTVRGASTITQQVMKNFLLDGRPDGRAQDARDHPRRRIEQTLSKDASSSSTSTRSSSGRTPTASPPRRRPISTQDARGPDAGTRRPISRRCRRRRRTSIRCATTTAPSTGATTCCARCSRTAISREEMERAAAAPLETVQGGHIEPYRASLPPATTSPTRSAASFRRVRRGRVSSPAGSMRASMDEDLQVSRNARCAARSRTSTARSGAGAGRSTGSTPKCWRAARRHGARRWPPPTSRCDIDGWHPPWCSRSGDQRAHRHRGCRGDEDGHFIPAEDVTCRGP
jgi:penicillin-binding protein 1A